MHKYAFIGKHAYPRMRMTTDAMRSHVSSLFWIEYAYGRTYICSLTDTTSTMTAAIEWHVMISFESV